MPIKILYIRLLFYIIILSVFNNIAQGQNQIWPGDVNNDGIVDNTDYLYWGYAFGYGGEARGNTSIEWNAQNLPQQLWQGTFTNGLNYCYADCTGDGYVDYLDGLVIDFNYGSENPNLLTPENFPVGVSNTPLRLRFSESPDSLNLFPSVYYEIDLNLGDVFNDINNFRGVAFTIDIDKTNIKPHILIPDGYVSFEAESNNINFVNYDSAFFSFEKANAEGNTDVCLVRTSPSSYTTNHGRIGKVKFVIEDDVPGILNSTVPVSIKIKNIKLITDYFEKIPVREDSMILQIVPNVLRQEETREILDNNFEIIPNPTKTNFSIITKNSKIEITRLELYDVLGRMLKTFNLNHFNDEFTLPNDLNDGIYYIRIETNKGITLKKVIISKNN